MEIAKRIMVDKLDTILNKPTREYVNPENLKSKKVKHHEDRHKAKSEALRLK